MIRKLFDKLVRNSQNKNGASVQGAVPSSDCLNLQPISLERYAAGKFCISASGTLPFRLVVVQCLLQACSVSVRFDGELFSTLMRQQSMPEYLISEYLKSVAVSDETYIDNPPIS